jgi:hypothetical protein
MIKMAILKHDYEGRELSKGESVLFAEAEFDLELVAQIECSKSDFELAKEANSQYVPAVVVDKAGASVELLIDIIDLQRIASGEFGKAKIFAMAEPSPEIH